MILKDIVPWGRLKKEYIKMFNLSSNDLESKILGCGDGPSSFNSECIGNIISVDPIYEYSKEEILFYHPTFSFYIVNIFLRSST